MPQGGKFSETQMNRCGAVNHPYCAPFICRDPHETKGTVKTTGCHGVKKYLGYFKRSRQLRVQLWVVAAFGLADACRQSVADAHISPVIINFASCRNDRNVF